MTIDQKMKVLVVDDDRIVRELITEFLRSIDVELITAASGQEAYDLAVEEKPDIILSDNVMPGMTGLELCRKIRKNKDFEMRIFILTSAVEITSEEVAEAIEQGADDFIKKDFSKVDFLARIRSYVRIRELQINLANSKQKIMQEKEELNNSYKQISAMTRKLEESNLKLWRISEQRKEDLSRSLELIAWLIDRRRHYHRGHSKEVAKICEFMARKMEFPEEKVQSVRTAALLHELGKSGIPDSLALKKPSEYTDDERALLEQHPVAGANLLAKYLGKESDIVRYIKHSHEKFDGTGFPDKLKGQEIPIGARILAIANLFDNMVNRRDKGSIDRFFEILEEKAGAKYDPGLIKYIRQFINESGLETTEKIEELRIYEVEPGMILHADIFTKSGMKLMHKGTVLDEHAISVLIKYNKIDPIEDHIYIKG
jgi:putative nucleotidyltransferase with HDIG domain